MKISGVDIRPGNILEYEKGIWKVAKTQHTQPGKGGAFMQVEMKNLLDGRKTNVRFRSQDTIEKVRLDTKDFQYLYAEGEDLVFMDKDNYEQITLPRDLLGDAAEFLQDGMDVVLELWEDRPISVELLGASQHRSGHPAEYEQVCGCKRVPVEQAPDPLRMPVGGDC
jgi:elongation factor P